MEMSTRTKWFLLLLAPCLAVFICRLPGYLSAFSQPWQQVLPAPPANTVMIVGASKAPNFVRTKDGKYYKLIGSSINNKKWNRVKNVNEKERKSLLESEYKLNNPLIPFLFNRPPGTVIDHFYTEQAIAVSGFPRYRVYYVLLDGGTLWSWRDPLLVDNHNMLNRFGVIYPVIVFVVTGVMLLVMNRVGRPLSLRKQNQLLLLMFMILFIATIIIFFCYTIFNMTVP